MWQIGVGKIKNLSAYNHTKKQISADRISEKGIPICIYIQKTAKNGG